MIEQPLLSIVVGTRNRPVPFSVFAVSVAKTASVPTELIVTDASDEPAFDERKNGHPYSTLMMPPVSGSIVHTIRIQERPRLGTLRGYNVGFRMARGRYVAWFNDDCELLPGWDRLAVDFMEAHPEIGMGAIYFRDPGMTRFYVQEYHGMVFANFGVVRREVGTLVDWFGEKSGIRMYGCDNNIALLILQAGHGICQIPGCKVLHHREMDDTRKQNMHEYVIGTEDTDNHRLINAWGGIGAFGQNVAALRETVYNKTKHLVGPIWID